MEAQLGVCPFPGFSAHSSAETARNAWNTRFSWGASPKQILPKTQSANLGLSTRGLGHRYDPKKGSLGVLSRSSVDLLDAWNDEYNGVVIEPAKLPSNPNAFAATLRASLSTWKMKGKRGIWLKLFAEQAKLVPVAIQEGFIYHHAEPGYVMLTYWIPNEPCTLPSGPSHQIGIAAFVNNDKGEILVVKETCSCSCSGVWKLPTGYIDKSEDLFSGAVREVKEETGIETTFMELVAFRHVHQVAFEKSDLLFVSMLKPLTFEIKIDGNEIQEAKWITLHELLDQQFYKDDPMSRRIIEICMAACEKHYNGFDAHQMTSKFDGKLSCLYYKDVDSLHH